MATSPTASRGYDEVRHSARSLGEFTAQAVLNVQVLNIVAGRIPQILNMGVPVPDHIPFYMDNVIPEDHDRQINNETQLSKHAPLHPCHP